MVENADSSESSVRFDNELGVHHTVSKLDSDNVTNQYEFEVESEAVFKRLAEDIYEGAKAGIREPLTNAVTAILRADENGYLDSLDEGVIIIDLYEDGAKRRLHIRDNGVGMTRDEIDQVVSVIGQSTSRSDTELTGQFGMGFLATWMLAGGVNGGFFMHTNPRGVDDGPISGVWDSNSFSELDGDAVDGLDEEEYGTEFEIMLGENIETESLKSWINKYAEWTRVPVLFRHFEEDGLTDEEFPPKRITDKYKAIENGESPSEFDAELPRNSDLQYYTIDTDYFRAISSNLNSAYYNQDINKTILLDVPVDTRWNISKHFPQRTLELRLKCETPVVVEGPHEGLFVVSENEASQLGDNFVSENEITSDDIVTPSPTGTRDMLQDSSGFIEWLGEQFCEMYYEDIAGLLREVDTIDQYCELDEQERLRYHNIIDELNDDYRLTASKVPTIVSRARTSFSTELETSLAILHEKDVSHAPVGESGVSRKENRERKPARDIITETYGTPTDVYMGHRITQERAEFVWESEKDHKVVQVNSGEQNVFEDVFDWKSLSNIDFETDLTMDEETRRQFTEDTKDLTEENITIHIGTHSNTESISVGELEQAVKTNETIIGSDETGYNISKIILFKRGGHNISDNKHMVGDAVATASVKKDVYDYLVELDCVWPAEEAVEKQIIIQGSDGNMYDLNDELSENIVTHVIDDNLIDTFRNSEVMTSIQKWLRDETDAPSDAVYLPLTPFETQFSGLDRHWRDWFIDTESSHGRTTYNTIDVESTVQIYARACLEECPVVEALGTVTADWNNGGKELIEIVESQLHE